MIASLRGTVVDRDPKGEVVLEVGGIGYRVRVLPSALAAAAGAEVRLHTHLQVREDSLTLYGFAGREERDCFEALIGAHGVGPALAMAVLSVYAPPELRAVLAAGDVEALTVVPGVGRRTAARLMVELKSRLDAGEVDGVPGESADAAQPRADVRAALAALGYGDDEVRAVLPDLPAAGGVEEMLRAALRLLAARR